MGRPLIPLTSSCAELMVRAYAATFLAVEFGYFGIFYAGPIAWITAAVIVTIGYFINIRKVAQKYYGDIDINQTETTFTLTVMLMLE